MDSRPTPRKKYPLSNKNGYLSTESTRRKLGTKSCDKLGGICHIHHRHEAGNLTVFSLRFFTYVLKAPKSQLEVM